MKYKAILLDLDNTLYDYNKPHSLAIDAVFDYCSKNFKIEKNKFDIEYKSARFIINNQLTKTASSHNRLLYFQYMLENLQINPLDHALELYNIYWDTFIKNMILYEGVYDFLKKFEGKVCIITDLTAEIQYRKIKKLKLTNLIDFIVTSEEAGIEKPSRNIFELALKKINLKKSEICMIGDNYEKDIVGGLNLGIKSFWFNLKAENIVENDNQNINKINSYKTLIELLCKK